MSQFEALCWLSGIARPHVIITDFDRALKNALSEQFLHVQWQLCIFHMNKNVVANIKVKCVGCIYASIPSNKV